jgi:hypothetical protein
MMKLISLTQPWASLVAVGLKRFETRSWDTTYRGDLAIHATKGPTDEDALQRICRSIPEASGLSLPHGVVLAVARLAACDEMTQAIVWSTDDRELAVGDWRPGRFALDLADVRTLREPLQIAVGSRGRPVALPADVEMQIRSLL